MKQSEIFDFVVRERLPFLLGTVVMLVSQANSSDKDYALLELKSAREYLDREIQMREAEMGVVGANEEGRAAGRSYVESLLQPEMFEEDLHRAAREETFGERYGKAMRSQANINIHFHRIGISKKTPTMRCEDEGVEVPYTQMGLHVISFHPHAVGYYAHLGKKTEHFANYPEDPPKEGEVRYTSTERG